VCVFVCAWVSGVVYACVRVYVCVYVKSTGNGCYHFLTPRGQGISIFMQGLYNEGIKESTSQKSISTRNKDSGKYIHVPKVIF